MHADAVGKIHKTGGGLNCVRPALIAALASSGLLSFSGVGDAAAQQPASAVERDKLSILSSALVCPETLSTNQARIDALAWFVGRAQRFYPALSFEELTALRAQLLKRHGCSTALTGVQPAPRTSAAVTMSDAGMFERVGPDLKVGVEVRPLGAAVAVSNHSGCDLSLEPSDIVFHTTAGNFSPFTLHSVRLGGYGAVAGATLISAGEADMFFMTGFPPFDAGGPMQSTAKAPPGRIQSVEIKGIVLRRGSQTTTSRVRGWGGEWTASLSAPRTTRTPNGTIVMRARRPGQPLAPCFAASSGEG